MRSLTPRRIRRDPAPSRWAYRLHRLWMTPLVRRVCRIGVPSLVVFLSVGIFLANADRRASLTQGVSTLREKFEARPEFQVRLVAIEGATTELADAVRAKLNLALPQSSFDIDLDAARERAESLDAVKTAELRVRSGGVLQVVITERQPVAVWRMPDGLTLIDEAGHRVAGLAARSDRPDLPLIAGDGADKAVPEALDILAAAQPLIPQLRGMTRMGERRWDLVMDRNQRILLPAENPVRAIEGLIALDAAQDLLARDVLVVDLRSEVRPSIRLAPNALTELRRATGVIDISESEL
jgi:cell division protein FtsQ